MNLALARSAVVLLLSALGPLAHAQAASTGPGPTYPTKPLRVVVAFAAGGFADGVARQIGQKLSERMGQPVVIDNRGGAGGNIGA